MAKNIGFKSYCWAVGTTSYRTDNFNMNIEWQLSLLKEFWSLSENRDKSWRGNNALQADYYAFLKEKGFVTGDANRPDKDAREKTSGLRDIGLLDDDRNITEAGETLLKISQSKDFSSDNLLEISKDSYLYFKQLLKTTNDVDGKSVRPFVVFLFVIAKLEYLTYEEFTYLLPLCVDYETTEKIIQYIIMLRNGELNYEDIILSVLMEMDNYKLALQHFQEKDVTEELVCSVGMNRKSAKYDKPYYKLYCLLKKIVDDQENVVVEFYNATKKLTNSKVGGAWRKYFFSSTARNVMKREGLSVLNDVPILKAKDENEFKKEFFKIMHLFKAKATLSDYFDLNRRYFKITDIVIFEDNKVRLDVLPKSYVEMVSDNFLLFAFMQTDLLQKNVSLGEIHPVLEIDAKKLYQRLGVSLGKEIADKESAKKVIRDERYVRFNKLIDEHFDRNTLITLLKHFEE